MSLSPARPLPLGAVTIDDPFWTPRQVRLRTDTLHAQFRQLVDSGRLRTLSLQWTEGSDEPKPHVFYESDIAKWIEAASLSLASHPDADLAAEVDTAIAALAGAQQPDGYLNAWFTVVDPDGRFADLHDAHELYGAGHLIEAAVAHHRATGSSSLLDVVLRQVDLIDSQFSPGGPLHGGYCGHEEIELALVKLHELTGDPRHLALARTFVDARGTRPWWFDVEAERRGHPGVFGQHGVHPGSSDPLSVPEYRQAHLPVREQTEAVGHAVRATYLYCAMTDLAVLDGDESLQQAVDTLWRHLTTRRMYVTGGIGSSRANEGFTTDHDLPNETAYAETCAAIGLVLWARRLASGPLGSPDHLDILERALYNGALAGVSADGQRFFYENPLASAGDVQRRDWFDCACCPPNLARLEAGLDQIAFTIRPGGTDGAVDELGIDLPIGARLRTDLGGAEVTVRIESEGPAGGGLQLTVDSPSPTRWALRVRVPGWAEHAAATLDGEPVPIEGDLRIEREWNGTSTVELGWQVPARRLYAHPAVAADVGRVALAHGPFIHCIEGVDLPGPAHAVVLPADAEITADGDALTAPAWLETADGEMLYPTTAPTRTPIELRTVRYHDWNNRGRSTMAVWIREG